MAAICRASRNSPTFTLHFMLCSFGRAGPSQPAPRLRGLPVDGFRGCVWCRPHAVAGGPQLGVAALALALEAELLALVFELRVLDDPGHRERLQDAVALDVDLDARDLLAAILTEPLRLGPLGELRTRVRELPVGVHGMPDLDRKST